MTTVRHKLSPDPSEAVADNFDKHVARSEQTKPNSLEIPMPDLKEPTPRLSNGEILRRTSLARGNFDEKPRNTGASLSAQQRSEPEPSDVLVHAANAFQAA